MPFEMSRADYHARYGLTTGDMLRLGDTNLYIHIERDYTSYGDEVLAGFGKTVRDGLMANSRLGRESELDLVLTNAIILDPILGVLKGNIGVKVWVNNGDYLIKEEPQENLGPSRPRRPGGRDRRGPRLG